MNATNSALFRQTPPAQINDQLQNIKQAQKSGLINKDDAETATKNLLGGNPIESSGESNNTTVVSVSVTGDSAGASGGPLGTTGDGGGN
jgi:hypothetical protein